MGPEDFESAAHAELPSKDAAQRSDTAHKPETAKQSEIAQKPETARKSEAAHEAEAAQKTETSQHAEAPRKSDASQVPDAAQELGAAQLPAAQKSEAGQERDLTQQSDPQQADTVQDADSVQPHDDAENNTAEQMIDAAATTDPVEEVQEVRATTPDPDSLEPQEHVQENQALDANHDLPVAEDPGPEETDLTGEVTATAETGEPVQEELEPGGEDEVESAAAPVEDDDDKEVPQAPQLVADDLPARDENVLELEAGELAEVDSPDQTPPVIAPERLEGFEQQPPDRPQDLQQQAPAQEAVPSEQLEPGPPTEQIQEPTIIVETQPAEAALAPQSETPAQEERVGQVPRVEDSAQAIDRLLSERWTEMSEQSEARLKESLDAVRTEAERATQVIDKLAEQLTGREQQAMDRLRDDVSRDLQAALRDVATARQDPQRAGALDEVQRTLEAREWTVREHARVASLTEAAQQDPTRARDLQDLRIQVELLAHAIGPYKELKQDTLDHNAEVRRLYDLQTGTLEYDGVRLDAEHFVDARFFDLYRKEFEELGIRSKETMPAFAAQYEYHLRSPERLSEQAGSERLKGVSLTEEKLRFIRTEDWERKTVIVDGVERREPKLSELLERFKAFWIQKDTLTRGGQTQKVQGGYWDRVGPHLEDLIKRAIENEKKL